MKKQNQNFKFLIVLLGIFTISAIVGNNGINESSTIPEEIIIEDYLPQSSYFNNTEDPIAIDGDATGVGAHNWTWASSQDWCRGSGTFGDPYVIENITINVQQEDTPSLAISDSNEYVIIQNVSLHNASGESGYTLLITRSNNTIIRNSTITSKDTCIIVGASSVPCHNITVANNTIYSDSNQGGSGIVFDVRDLNDNLEIYGNNISTMAKGLRIMNIENLTIYNNTILNCSMGIEMDGSSSTAKYNTIHNNTFYNCSYGLYILSNTDENTYHSNQIRNCSIGAYIAAGSDDNLLYGNHKRFKHDYGKSNCGQYYRRVSLKLEQ